MKATFLLIIFALVTVVSFSVDANAQCGTYFKPGYRAVGKIAPGNFFGSPFVLHDWTGDGRLDFWNFRQTQVNGAVEIVIYPALATGYWNWDAPIVYATGLASGAHTGTVSPVVRDFDGDGLIDLLVTILQSGTRVKRIHRNLGNNTLQALTPTNEPGSDNMFARHIGYEDVNGDQRLDWLYYMEDFSGPSDSINYALQNVDGSFGPFVTVLAQTPENEVDNSVKSAGDFNGDGKIDIAYQSLTSPERRIRMLKGNGDGTFVLGAPQTMIGSNVGVNSYDFNLDGRDDILALGGPQFVIYYGQTDGSFVPESHALIANPTVGFIRVAELNGDNRPDIVNILNQEYEVFVNNSSGGFTRTHYPRRFMQAQYQFVLSDFNADGKDDLWDSSHETKNTFNEEVVAIYTNVCHPVGSTQAMNFDSAPPYDIATWNGATGEWLSANGNWPSNGVLSTRSFTWGSASLGDVPAPGDFDGDSKTDYSVYRNGEGNWYIYLSSNDSWFVFRFGLPGDIPIPNDYDGGGKTDIAVFRPSDGNWYIWYTETQQFAALHWGSDGDRPVPADYDGDGKTDIGVFRPSTGDWYFVRSSDSSYGIFHWGTTGDIPMPGDYDGDGRADLTVFRAGEWHMLRSTNGAYQVILWGTTGDVPVLFLERGEIAHPLIYRPSTGRWYHRRYFLGVVATTSGTPINFGLPNN